MKISVLVDIKKVITAYGACLSEMHNPLEDGFVLETSLDLKKINLVGDYKLINSELVKLTEEEKPIIEPRLSEIEKLKLSQAEQFEYTLKTLEGMM